jgi:RNA polymerase sigma-70 factor (ECF subfamily)
MAQYVLPMEADERRVVEYCSVGDDAAFDLLYRNYAAPLRQFCLARLGEAADAEDVCHETLLRAFRAFGGFREGARVWPWLATIAGNLCVDVQRERGRFSGPEALAGREAEGPHEETVRRIRTGVVTEAIKRLPERYRAYVWLKDFEGWSYEQVAEVDGTSVASVRSALMRARRALKARIKEVAEKQGNWPLPAFVPLLWARVRSGARDAAAALWPFSSAVNGVGAGLANMVLAAVAVGTAGAGVTTVASPVFAPASAAVHVSQAPVPSPPAPAMVQVTHQVAPSPTSGPPAASNDHGRGGVGHPADRNVTPAIATPTNTSGEPRSDQVIGPVAVNCRPGQQGPVTGLLCPVLPPNG